MAYRLNFSNPYGGMSYIWNISNHVGDQPSCQNNPTDVDLVSLLLGAFIRIFEAGAGIHPSCRQPFNVNGSMDINIAYWIRVINSQHVKKLGLSEMGIISPATKATYGSDTWSIVKLNRLMFDKLPEVWRNLPTHYQCPPQLKDELLNKTSP